MRSHSIFHYQKMKQPLPINQAMTLQKHSFEFDRRLDKVVKKSTFFLEILPLPLGWLRKNQKARKLSCKKTKTESLHAFEQPSKNSTTQIEIVLTFSSFLEKDLKSTFNLFQNYLTYLTNQLIAHHNNSIALTRFKGLKEAKANQKVVFYYWRSALKTIRLLNRPVNKVLSIPQPITLHTLIKSPHVFKKTREQFASTFYKNSIKFHLDSEVSFQIFLNSFTLLKLPAEVKMILKRKKCL